MEPTPVLGFFPRGDCTSRAAPPVSEMSAGEMPATPVSPLSLAFRKPGSVPRLQSLKVNAHRRSFSEDGKLASALNAQGSSCDCSRASSMAATPIPIPETRRSQFSEEGSCAERFHFVPMSHANFFSHSRHSFWDTAAHQPRNVCEAKLEKDEDEDEEFMDAPDLRDQEVFDLEIPFAELPVMRGLSRIKISFQQPR